MEGQSAPRDWADAYESLARADAAAQLGADELELLAQAAYMTGRDEEFVSCLERAHQARLDAGEVLPAVRCAFWLGINLATRGEMGRASGWFGRAQRMLEQEEGDSAERGYLLIPAVLEHVAAGDWRAAGDTAAAAAEIGQRLGDPDLLALALHEQGHALVKQGRIADGLRLLDEAMLAVTAEELSPIVTGLVYCSVIAYCQELYELRRAQEWTAALTGWCERQPGMVAYTGQCLVHRAEIMQLGGAWMDALEEARRARKRFALDAAPATAAHREGAALYRQAEILRLRGELAEAEEAYRAASRCGWEPQPGLALLRLAQGDTEAALAAIRRVLSETSDPLRRARLLPAHAELLLAAGDAAGARAACRELEETAAAHDTRMLGAMVAQTRGSVDLAEGDAPAALTALRRASQAWQDLGAPYEAALARELMGAACRAMGDDDTAAMEIEAARAVFEKLGAAPDLARLDSRAGVGATHGLTERELQVLRLVAAGETNKAVAARLVVSDRTVDRHVSNIFAKLGVSSRSAATAWAYEHKLI